MSDDETTVRTRNRSGSQVRRRHVVLGSRCTPDEAQMIEAAAKRAGKSVAGWLRDLALDAARVSS